MKDTFTRDRFAWLDQVLADDKVTDQAFVVAYALATKFLSRQKGFAWPSLEALGKAVNKSARRVQPAVANLVARGHLTLKRGGKGHTNQYRLQLFDRTETSDHEPVKEDESVRSNVDMTGQECPINETLTGHLRSDDRTNSVNLTGRVRPTNPLIEPIEDSFEKESPEAPASKSDEGKGFEELWLHYPRKKGKGAAAKAYRQALKRVEHQTLKAAVLRYASERKGQNPAYTPHMATWLNQERWTDEPDAPAKGGLEVILEEIRNQFGADKRSDFSNGFDPTSPNDLDLTAEDLT